MPRKGPVPKREVLPDPIYGSIVVTKLLNNIMLDGQKGTAQKIVYGAFDIVKEKTGKEPLAAFEEALNNIMPVLEVSPSRRQTLGLRWLVTNARKRSERTMRERLAGELMDALNNSGASVKKKEDTHKMAEANRAFAQSKW